MDEKKLAELLSKAETFDDYMDMLDEEEGITEEDYLKDPRIYKELNKGSRQVKSCLSVLTGRASELFVPHPKSDSKYLGACPRCDKTDLVIGGVKDQPEYIGRNMMEIMFGNYWVYCPNCRYIKRFPEHLRKQHGGS